MAKTSEKVVLPSNEATTARLAITALLAWYNTYNNNDCHKGNRDYPDWTLDKALLLIFQLWGAVFYLIYQCQN